MKKLNIEALKSRRTFLRQSAKKAAKAVVVVYAISKSTKTAFGREPE